MVEVYERGQVVIPKYIRDLFHIVPGTQVNFSVEDRKIVIEPVDSNALLREIRKGANMSSKEVDAAIAECRRKRHEEWLDVH